LQSGACSIGDAGRFKHLNAEQIKELDERTATELKAKETEADTATTTTTTPSSSASTSTSSSVSTSASAADPAALSPPRAGATETIFRERKTIDFHHKVYVGPLTT
jgi:hypothetical protein